MMMMMTDNLCFHKHVNICASRLTIESQYVCVPLPLLHSVAVKSYKIPLPNYQSQLPIADDLCLALAKLPITFDCLVASENFMFCKTTLFYVNLLSLSLCASDKIVIAWQPSAM